MNLKKCVRREKVQADYVIDLLRTYDNEKATGTFIFDFYPQRFTHNNNRDNDYDMASSSITKSIGGITREPKELCHMIADYYKE